MWRFLQALYSYGGRRLLGILTLSIVVGLGNGAGLLLLVPLLIAVGFGDGQAQSGLVEAIVGLIPAGFATQDLLIWVLIFYVCLIAALAVANAASHVLTAGFVQGFGANLRKRAHGALLDATWLHTARLRHSHVVNSLVMDAERVRHGAQQLITLCGTASLAVVYFAIAAALRPLAGGILFLLAVGVLFALRPLSREAEQSGARLSAAYREMQSATEHVSGIKLTKSLGAEPRVRAWYAQAADGVTTQAVRLARVQARTQVWHRLAAAAVLGVLAYVAIGVLALSLPVLAIFAVLFARLTPRFRTVQQGVQGLRNALPAFDELTGLIQNAQAAREGGTVAARGSAEIPELCHAITLARVTFRYAGNTQPALRDLTAEIPARGITLVAGPSGAGKSTLADLLMGLSAPTEGDIRIDGCALGEHNRLAWRPRVAYLPQEAPLYAGTIRDNLEWAAPSATEKELWAALTRAHADRMVEQLDMGLDTVLGDRGLRLSGGQRQRIALARTLLRQPQLLILDEATAGLDTPTASDIEATLEALAQQMAVVLLGHNHRPRTGTTVIDLTPA